MKTQSGRKVREARKRLKGCDAWELDGFGTPTEKKTLKRTTSKALRRVAKKYITQEMLLDEKE